MVSSKKLLLTALGVMVIASMILAACTPTEVIRTVVVTEEVMVEGTPQIVTQIVTVEPEVPPEEAAEGPILAEEGLVPCQPIPEVATTSSIGSAPHLASVVGPVKSSVEDASGPSRPVLLSPQQQAGATYKVGTFEDVTTTNFFAANGPDNTVYNSYMLPPRLAMFGLSDKYFTFVPNVAAVPVPDPLVEEGDFWVTSVPMRDDITWSDGTPFTANDVAFTANAVLDLGLISGNWSAWYDGNFVDHLEAVDDFTVKYFFHTKPGLARFEYGILQAPILSAAYWTPVVEEALAPITALGDSPSEEDLAAAQAETQDILFTHVPDGEPLAGQFVFNRWEQGAFMQNDANADYYDTGNVIEQWANAAYSDSSGLTVGTPEGDVETTYEVGPFVESVVYTIYGSQDAAILALREGEVDFVLNSLGLQRGLAEQISNDPNLTVIENPTNGFRYMSFNVRRKPMNDCAFRQAVAVLIDKEFVTGTVLQGVASPYYGFVPPGNAFWYNPEVPELGAGLDRETRTNLAIAILEQAGFSWEGDQKPVWDGEDLQVVPGGRLLMPDGTPVPPLTMPAPSAGYDPLRSTFAIWIETWLNEFGIPLQANLAGFNTIVPIIFTEQNFDMYILGWSLGVFPDYLRDFFAEEQAALDGNNAGGYINPDVEANLNEILTCESFETCREISNEIQVILATELPYVLLFDTGIVEAFRSASVEYPYTVQLSGLQYTHQGGGALQSEVRVK